MDALTQSVTRNGWSPRPDSNPEFLNTSRKEKCYELHRDVRALTYVMDVEQKHASGCVQGRWY
jgi:hypothetical protein